MRVLGVPYFQRGPHFFIKSLHPVVFRFFELPCSRFRTPFVPGENGRCRTDKSGCSLHLQDTFFFRNAARFLPHISYPVIFNNVESFGQFLLGNTEILSYFFITFDFALSIGKTQINCFCPRLFRTFAKDGPKP